MSRCPQCGHDTYSPFIDKLGRVYPKRARCGLCGYKPRPSVEKKPGCFENALYEPGALACLSCDVRDECRKKKWAEVEKPQREYREWKGIP